MSMHKESVHAGFTLVEMLVVLMIMAILAAITLGVTSRRQQTAWEHKARDTAKQIATAWNTYLMDKRCFPDDLKNKAENEFNDTALDYLSPKEGGTVYIELTDKERREGLKDHWGGFFYFALDGDYDGKVDNPAPRAFSKNETDFAKITASSIVWSKGRDPNNKTKWIVTW